jgi:hypothetical protein
MRSRHLALVLAACGGHATIHGHADGASGDSNTPPPDAFGTGIAHYAAPDGSPSGDGTMEHPWDIATAFAQPAALGAGDILYLRGGTYVTAAPQLQSMIAGAQGQPILVRGYPGERATLGHTLQVFGSYAWYQDLEVTEAASWSRTTDQCGSFTDTGSHDGVYITQGVIGAKLIDLVIHDTAGGIGDQDQGTGTEVYGCVIYNVGWASSCDRGHGHALYVQNNASGVVKNYDDNIAFNSFDIGIQAYGAAPPITHLHFHGNIAFDNGLPYGHRVDNVIVAAGSAPKADIVLDGNVFYNPLDASSDNTGYNDLTPTWDGSSNVDLAIANNYWIGAPTTGYTTVLLNGWQSLAVHGNTIVGPLTVQNITTNDWSGNTYYASAPPAGVDPASAVHTGLPAGASVVVRPNRYEAGRAHVAIMNWDKAASVVVDLSTIGLHPGDHYVVRDAQDFYGAPVASGTYDGQPIAMPMTTTEVAPVLYYATTPPHTSAEFGAFVVMKAP